MLKGQDELLTQINSYTLDTIPRSVILLGLKGCGKHSLITYIANRLDLPTVFITESIDNEVVETFITRPQPYIYVFNTDFLSIKQQNVLLKFIEEPLKNSYIFICCETKSQLLDTILNRCIIWSFKNFLKRRLRG